MSQDFEILEAKKTEENIAEGSIENPDASDLVDPEVVQEYLRKSNNDDPIDLKITDEDRDEYFASVVDDRPYRCSVSAFGGRMIVHCRDRTMSEMEEIFDKISKDNLTLNVEYDTKIQMYHLAYAVCKISYLDAEGKSKDHDYDKGSLLERVERLKKISNHKYLILVECMVAFDRKVLNLKREALQENF